MYGTEARLRSGRARIISSIHVMMVVGLLAGMIGCADNRISQQEFLDLQTRMATEKAEAEAPPADAVLASLNARFGPYIVGPQDVLLVTLTSAAPGALFEPINVRVGDDGQIDLPLIRSVDVNGMSLKEVEEAIHAGFVPQVVNDAAVHVELVSEDGTEVLVIGAVVEPGLVRLGRNHRDLLHAIVAAGGVTQQGSGRATLQRIRQRGDEQVVDLTDPDGLREAMVLPPLDTGDIITVEAAMPNTIFVGGLVRFGRPQQYDPGVNISVLQAIAAASGLRTDVAPREATLIRRMSNGKDVHVKLDLDRIRSGQDQNLILAAGDILWVPETLETRVQDFINRNIFFRAGVSVNYSVTGIEFLNRQDQQSGYAGSGDLQDQFDPFGFLSRNQSLQTLTSRPEN